MSDRSSIIQEANDLGLEFKGNISSVKLIAMIAEFKGEPIPDTETAPSSPAMKPEPEEEKGYYDDEEGYEDSPRVKAERSMSAREIVAARYKKKRTMIAKAKKAAAKTMVVTLTNKDNRENDIMTTAFLSYENQYFGMAKNVPLDIPVELEVALIDIAEKCTMTLHKDEIIDGKRTGNKTNVTVKKYAISYSQRQVG